MGEVGLASDSRITPASGFTLWFTGLSGSVKSTLGECIRRYTKGLYRRALAGDIPQFTGVSDPYEEPLEPELVIDTEQEDVAASAARVIGHLGELGYLRSVVDA